MLQMQPPRETFFYLWGADGAGKSHLLQASCASHENSAYLPLSNYAGESEAVLEGLEQLDLVCIDDIHLVLGKAPWEEKLFALFNASQAAHNCLVVSSGLAPREVKYELADLASRFSSGVVYHLHNLSDENKKQALKLRAEGIGMPLQDEVLDYICLRSERSTTSLFAVLEKLERLSLAEKRRITIPFVRELMQW